MCCAIILKSYSFFLVQGTWISSAGLEQPSEIQKCYFRPTTEILTKQTTFDAIEDSTLQGQVYFQYAEFAERQYQLSVMSPEYERRRLYVERMEEEVDQLKKVADAGQLKKSKATLDEDKKLFDILSEARFTFLRLAIDMFARCLSVSDKYHEETVIRLCSLWFSNFADERLNQMVANRLLNIPSHKFIFLSHQLSSRLIHSRPQPSQDTLQKLLRRLCSLHPFHTLYQIYALYQGNPAVKDMISADQAAPPQRRTSRSTTLSTEQTPQTDRALAAVTILRKLESDPTISRRILAIEKSCETFIAFAKHPLNDNDKKKPEHVVPRDLNLKVFKDVKVPVLTGHLEVDPTGKYDDIPYIETYDTKFTLAGGINVPKIIVCRTSDGTKHKQLVGPSYSDV